MHKNRCTKTVCGLSRLTNYSETLSTEDKVKVVEKRSETKFKFGWFFKVSHIPAQIGNSEITVQMLSAGSYLSSRVKME